jgi:hypothetical protein
LVFILAPSFELPQFRGRQAQIEDIDHDILYLRFSDGTFTRCTFDDLPDPRSVNPKQRFRILSRDNFRCCLCGASAKDGITLHVDHRISVADGGSSEDDNLWVLCCDCNAGKGAQSL